MTMWIERLAKPSPTNEPPTRAEWRRNDLMVGLLVLFALFLAVGVRNQVYNASKSAKVGPSELRIAYPEAWRAQTVKAEEAGNVLVQVINPGSPSLYDTRITVEGRPLRTDESLEKARFDRSIKLATSLPSFRELAAEQMTVYDGRPALVSSYAYVDDPTRATGSNGLPVVVEAQDIMFIDGGQFVVVTLAADAAAWNDEQRNFGIVTNSLKLTPLPEPAATPNVAPTASGAGPASGTVEPAPGAGVPASGTVEPATPAAGKPFSGSQQGSTRVPAATPAGQSEGGD